MHRQLTVLDLPGGARVLALHPDGVTALLQISRLVHDQNRVGVTQVLRDELTHVRADLPVIPLRPAEQVLHPVRRGVPGVLGDRPTVLPRQRRQQPSHEVPHPPTRLRPAETRSHGQHQVVEQHPPPLSVYPISRSHRRVMVSPHNRPCSTVAAPAPAPGEPSPRLRSTSPAGVLVSGIKHVVGRHYQTCPVTGQRRPALVLERRYG